MEKSGLDELKNAEGSGEERKRCSKSCHKSKQEFTYKHTQNSKLLGRGSSDLERSGNERVIGPSSREAN